MAQRWGLPIVAWPSRLRPNLWDGIALPLVLGGIITAGWISHQMSQPFHPGQTLPISLDPRMLPAYALRTVARMALALVVSLTFSIVYAAAAAKSRRAEKLLIPILDVLQSVPILGFLSITVTGFIALFPGSLLGYECAAVFAIFTSQAWNMTFSLYQSFTTVPKDLREAARMYQRSAWKTFWQLDMAFATPQLVWNIMMSVAGGWFFVVASEAITVNDQSVLLPGIGSYIAAAIDHKDLHAVIDAIVAMIVVIIVVDQLLFRPLLAWSQKFKFEQIAAEEVEPPWFLVMLQRAGIFRALSSFLATAAELSRHLGHRLPSMPSLPRAPQRAERAIDIVWVAILLIGAVLVAGKMVLFIHHEVGESEIVRVVGLGAITLARVIVLIALAAIVWVPIGVWIGLRPNLAHRVQPVLQLLAAFPANLLFPIAVVTILHFHLNVEIWLSPLMILGTQWYILFNVIAGTLALPTDYQQAAAIFGVRSWLWWKRLVLPGIFPAFVTGAITASGGSWNASIVSEVVKWGDTTLQATGIGAYIANQTAAGDFPRIALGIAVLSLYVVVFNRLLWRRLYHLAEKRLRLD
ncbi:MAG: ABC transporter permease [Stellaceae bacterium]